MKVHLIFIITFLFQSCQQSAKKEVSVEKAQTPLKYSFYTDTINGFITCYPSEWEITTKDSVFLFIAKRHKGQDSSKAIFFISKTEMNHDITLGSILNSTAEAYREREPLGRVNEKSIYVTARGIQYALLTTSEYYKGKSYTRTQAHFPKSDRLVFQLTFDHNYTTAEERIINDIIKNVIDNFAFVGVFTKKKTDGS